MPTNKFLDEIGTHSLLNIKTISKNTRFRGGVSRRHNSVGKMFAGHRGDLSLDPRHPHKSQMW